jgi:sugar phosphate permease
MLALALLGYAVLDTASVTGSVIALGLIGASLFGPDSLISGAAAQDAGGPRAASMATGFVNGVGSIGAILEGICVPWISRVFGWHAVFPIFVGMAVVAAVCLLPTLWLSRGARAT